MRAWLGMLGGLLIWTAHFAGLYALASWLDLVPLRDPAGAAIILGFSVVCLAAAAALLWRSIRSRRRHGPDFETDLSRYGAMLALAAITLQTFIVCLA